MSNSSKLEDKHARNRQERLRFIKEWAQYVRTHPDDDWGEQVNRLVNSQIESARSVEHERPDMDRLREESPLLNGGGDRGGDGDRGDDAEPTDDATDNDGYDANGDSDSHDTDANAEDDDREIGR